MRHSILLALLITSSCAMNRLRPKPVVDLFIYNKDDDSFCVDHNPKKDCVEKDYVDGYIVIPFVMFEFMMEEIIEARKFD